MLDVPESHEVVDTVRRPRLYANYTSAQKRNKDRPREREIENKIRPEPHVKAKSRLPSGCVYDDRKLLIFWIVAPGEARSREMALE